MKHVPSTDISKVSLSNKNILITGAGSGIGRAVAKIAAKNDANLILLSKDIKNLYSLQDEICDEGRKEPLIVEFDFLKASETIFRIFSVFSHIDYDRNSFDLFFYIQRLDKCVCIHETCRLTNQNNDNFVACCGNLDA